MSNIFTQIASDIVKDWDAAVLAIEGSEKKIVAAVPSLQPEISALTNDVKQGASDLLGAAGTFLGNGAKPLASGVEAAADAALAGLGSGAASVLDPIANNAINLIVSMGVSALQAWALEAKAKLAIPTPPPAVTVPSYPPSEPSTAGQ
jgi:hypothetical protein